MAREGRIAIGAARIMRVIGKHWLVVANLMMLLLVGLPLLAPVMAHSGEQGVARAIHVAFTPFCHQLPERSFFLFGPQATYTADELSRVGVEALSRRFTGTEELGYKVAVCQRCLAIYAAWLGFGLLFGLVRVRLRPIQPRSFLLLLIPIAVDGVGQLFGLWASTWQSRLVTGAMFALALVWFAYPYLEQGMAEMHQDAVRTLAERGVS